MILNPVELRYEIFKKLVDLEGRGDLREVRLDSPVPGQPLTITSTVQPYVGAAHTYRVTIERIDS